MPRAKNPKSSIPPKKQVVTMPSPEAKNGPGRMSLENEIRLRAYALYQERNGRPGNEKDDWLVAEREILARFSQRRA